MRQKKGLDQLSVRILIFDNKVSFYRYRVISGCGATLTVKIGAILQKLFKQEECAVRVYLNGNTYNDNFPFVTYFLSTYLLFMSHTGWVCVCLMIYCKERI